MKAKDMSFTISYNELSSKVRKAVAPTQKAFKNKKAYNRRDENNRIKKYEHY